MPEQRPQPPGKHGRRRKWKRTVILALLLLAGGAIVNVAVAWGFALFASMPQNSVLSWEGVQWLKPPPADWPEPRRRWDLSSRGLELVVVASRGNDRWIRQQRICTGVPMRALCMSAELEFLNGQADVTWHGSLRIPIRNVADKARAVPVKGVPWVPVWPGFIVNTLVYAAMLWLVFVGPFHARRALRRKRRLCEKCAYPIGVSAVCTECGVAVRPLVARSS